MPIAGIGFNRAQPVSERKPGDDDRSEWQLLRQRKALAQRAQLSGASIP